MPRSLFSEGFLEGEIKTYLFIKTKYNTKKKNVLLVEYHSQVFLKRFADFFSSIERCYFPSVTRCARSICQLGFFITLTVNEKIGDYYLKSKTCYESLQIFLQSGDIHHSIKKLMKSFMIQRREHNMSHKGVQRIN